MLTTEEYERLEAHYALPNDVTLINYKAFCDEIATIFTAADIERDPLKRI